MSEKATLNLVKLLFILSGPQCLEVEDCKDGNWALTEVLRLDNFRLVIPSAVSA